MNTLIAIFFLVFGSSDCPEHFWHGKEPLNTRPGLQIYSDRILCFQAFSVYHSGTTLTPLWSAEHLTGKGVEEAHGLPRENDFHEEERIPAKFRSWLSDYRGSGMDRGHCTPSADAPSASAQRETFSLANMIPQNSELNRGLWERIERAVRLLAMREGDLYVITGPLFHGQTPRVGRVQVPSHIWKLIYDPTMNAGAVYLCTNTDTDTYTQLTIPQFEALSGFRFGFEGALTLQLPKPKHRKSRDLF